MVDEFKVGVGTHGGLPALVELTYSANEELKFDAIRVIANVVAVHDNAHRVMRCGVLDALYDVSPYIQSHFHADILCVGLEQDGLYRGGH